jgi:hypothetical protein
MPARSALIDLEMIHGTFGQTTRAANAHALAARQLAQLVATSGNALPADYVLRVAHLVSETAYRIAQVLAEQLVTTKQRDDDADENKGIFAIGLTAISPGGRFAEPKI